MSNQYTPPLHAPAFESTSQGTIDIPSGRSFADLIWYLTPVLTCVVVALCLLILYQTNDGSLPLANAGGDGPQPEANLPEEPPANGEQAEPEKPDAESNEVGKMTVEDFVNALKASNNSREQIATLLESLGKPVEASDGGDGKREIGEQVKKLIDRFHKMSAAEATLKQLNDQVGEEENRKKDLDLQLKQATDSAQKLDGDIKRLRGELDELLGKNGVSADTKAQLLQGRDTLKPLAEAREKMVGNLEAIAERQAAAAVNATSADWTRRMNWISRMANVIPVRHQRLFIVIPLIDPQSYKSVKDAVVPLEEEFLTWETKFDGLEIWCFVVQGDRPPELCRWPLEYHREQVRNLWAVSGNTGNGTPKKLNYPLTPQPLKAGQVEKYLFVLPVDGTTDVTEFPFPLEATFDVVLVHDRSYAELRAKEDEFKGQLYSVQKSAGLKMESLSVLPSSVLPSMEGKASEFQDKLQQLVRRSALAMGKVEAPKDGE